MPCWSLARGLLTLLTAGLTGALLGLPGWVYGLWWWPVVSVPLSFGVGCLVGWYDARP